MKAVFNVGIKLLTSAGLKQGVCLYSMISTSHSGFVPPLAQSGMVHILRRPALSSHWHGWPMRRRWRSQRIAAEGEQPNVEMPAKPP